MKGYEMLLIVLRIKKPQLNGSVRYNSNEDENGPNDDQDANMPISLALQQAGFVGPSEDSGGLHHITSRICQQQKCRGATTIDYQSHQCLDSLQCTPDLTAT